MLLRRIHKPSNRWSSRLCQISNSNSSSRGQSPAGGRTLRTSAASALSASASDTAGDLSSRWQNTADTVIIGGGCTGVSTAYHLAKQSNQDVVLLEKSELTAGSTWHAAGLTTTYHPMVNCKRLHWYSLNLYAQIGRETGQQVGLHQPGSIRLGTSPVRMDEFKYQMSRQGWNQAPQCWLTPEEIKEKVPIIDIEGGNVLGGIFNPYDGHVDPYSLTQALAAGARKHGAKLYQKAEVTALNPQEDGGWEIVTAQGSIKAKRVVNATGFWAREVCQLTGLNQPLVAIHHQYLVTKSVPEVQQLKREFPVLRHLDGSFYLRQERDGLLVGPYESPETMKMCDDWAKSRVPPGFGKELFEPDLDRLQPHLETAMEIVPCFQNAEIQSVVNGPITYSPDVLPMLGPIRAPNMWMCIGFGYGIAHAGGAGKYLADWILNGEPTYDLAECDPERFGKWATLDYVLAKARETYGMNNCTGYPHEDRPAGRPTSRVSMVHDDLVEAGAFMGFHAGWEQPEWYAEKAGQKPVYKPSYTRTNWHEAVLREHSLVTSKVGLVDLTPFSKFQVSGPDARSFLDHVVSGHVPKPGRTSVAHALTDKGKVYAEFTLTGLDEGRFLVVTGSGVEGHDLRHLEHVALSNSYDVSICNVTEDMNVLSIAGPNAGQLMSRVCKDVTDNKSVDEWKFLDAKQCVIGGVGCLAIRISYTGELGWEFYIPRAGVRDVYKALLKNGADLGLGHFGTHTLDTLRLEKGFKMWGNEMNMDVDVLEAGLDGFVRWKKQANFIGKETLQSKRHDFRLQRLTMLSVDLTGCPADPEGNENVWLAGRVIGNTTSGCFSPTLGAGLVFAYVPALVDVPGHEVEVEILGHKRPATVLDGPPVMTQPARERK